MMVNRGFIGLCISIVMLMTFAEASAQAQTPCPLPADDLPTITIDAALLRGSDTTTYYNVLEPVVLAYFNDGGTPDNFVTQLNDTLAFESDYGPLTWRVQAEAVNVMGDTANEQVVQVAITDTSRPDTFIQGVLWVLECDDGAYQPHRVADIHGNRGEQDGHFSPESGLLMATDVTGDDRAELVISSITNIAIHANYTRVFRVYYWDDAEGDFRQIVYPYETFEGRATVDDVDGDGINQLIVTSPAFRHHNVTEWSRLSRATSTIYRWNGHELYPYCFRSAGQPTYRVQAVQDGYYAIRCGDDEAALAAYQQAIHDDSLLTWREAQNLCPGCEDQDLGAWQYEVEQRYGPDIDSHNTQRLIAYAHYRSVMLYAVLGRIDEAQAEYATLQADFPGGTAGAEFVALADAFLQTYIETEDRIAACDAVNATSAGAEGGPLQSPLNRYTFVGGSFRNDFVEDICPF